MGQICSHTDCLVCFPKDSSGLLTVLTESTGFEDSFYDLNDPFSVGQNPTTHESRTVAMRVAGRSKSPGKPKRRTPAYKMHVPGGITDKMEMWLMPKGTLPAHKSYHPRWLFFKQHNDAHAIAEYLTYRVFEVIEPNLCPPVYLVRDGDGYASLMRWAGKNVKDAIKARPGRLSGKFNACETRDLAIMTVVDALTANSDRHEGNLLKVQGRIIPIDHGLGFWSASPQGIRCRSPWRVARKYTHLWIREINTTLDVIASKKRRIVNLLNKSLTVTQEDRPMTVARLTKWIAGERKRVNAKGFKLRD